DVVGELQWAGRGLAVLRFPVLTGGQLEVPVLEQPLLGFLVDAIAFVGFDLQLPLAADVRQVGRDRAAVGSATGDFDHDLGGPADRSHDLLNLGRRELNRPRRTRPAGTEDVQERGTLAGQAYRSTHCEPPS